MTQAEEIAYWQGYESVTPINGSIAVTKACRYDDDGLWDAWQAGSMDAESHARKEQSPSMFERFMGLKRRSQ